MDEGYIRSPTGVYSWAPLILIPINDLNAGLSLTVRLFADDCAICRVITKTKDCDDLQADLKLDVKGSILPIASIAHPWSGLTLSDILGENQHQTHLDRPCIGGQNEGNTCVEST